MNYRIAIVICALLASLSHAAPPATQPTTRPVLKVSGKVSDELTLDADALAGMTRVEVKVKDHAGVDAVYSGVPLREILQKAGAPIGNNQMRGKNLALFVAAGAKDGYRVVFALAELDTDIADRDVLVADQRDGQPLNEKEGPFRIIVPGEKKPARWIRQLTSLRIDSATP